MKRAILVRGHSGSGKSAFAKFLSENFSKNISVKEICASDFFKYYYDESDTLIEVSHEWCKDVIKDWCEEEVNLIIVHNTFSKLWEVETYKKLLETYDYKVRVVSCENNLDTNLDYVPPEKVQIQKENYETYNKKLKPKPKRPHQIHKHLIYK